MQQKVGDLTKVALTPPSRVKGKRRLSDNVNNTFNTSSRFPRMNIQHQQHSSSYLRPQNRNRYTNTKADIFLALEAVMATLNFSYQILSVIAEHLLDRPTNFARANSLCQQLVQSHQFGTVFFDGSPVSQRLLEFLSREDNCGHQNDGQAPELASAHKLLRYTWGK